MKTDFEFIFGNFPSRVVIRENLPSLDELYNEYPELKSNSPALIICDANTEPLAAAIAGKEGSGKEGTSPKIPVVRIPAGESSKTWESIELILKAAKEAALGRDGLFIGVGGGVISDLAGFAASIYMRGARLCIVSTSLLGMVDASLGGKTGIDLAGIKNLAGTFYPAGLTFIPLSALDTLPEREWKSGMAELIKTGILASASLFSTIMELSGLEAEGRGSAKYRECLKNCISLAIAYKGSVVEKDPEERGTERALLNLGHTFAHALESAAGLGTLSHGEAVAWGLARACELGLAAGITPPQRAAEITGLLKRSAYEVSAPHPCYSFPGSEEKLYALMMSDKKNRAGQLRFIVPGPQGAQIIMFNNTASDAANAAPFTNITAISITERRKLLLAIIKGEC